MTTKWNIVTRAQNRVKDYPSALGSAVVVDYVEDAAQECEQLTGQSIDLTDIGSKWHGPLTYRTAAEILGYMNGVGVSYSAGRLSIDKKTELMGQEIQQRMFINRFNASIDAIGRRIEYVRTDPK